MLRACCFVLVVLVVVVFCLALLCCVFAVWIVDVYMTSGSVPPVLVLHCDVVVASGVELDMYLIAAFYCSWGVEMRIKVSGLVCVWKSGGFELSNGFPDTLS